MQFFMAMLLTVVSVTPGQTAQPRPIEVAEAPPVVDLAARDAARQSMARGLAYLSGTQGADGAWKAFDEPHPAVTALVVKAMAQDDRFGPSHPAVQRGMEFILTHVKPDGGIYVDGQGMRNYHTSVALMALAAVRDAGNRKIMAGARRFLVDLQWDSGEGHETSSTFYGGAGYGKHKRPDLSNTQIMLDALKESGLPEDDPAYQKALVFVSRCQMLSGTNDQLFAKESTDGGFVYSPANGGESKAGTGMVEGKPMLRAYGSMTYAGFKSLLYAGLDESDPRVAAAVVWISKYYTLDANPNMPGAQSQEGLYYYYHTFARALNAWGRPTITDAKGIEHDWRKEICDAVMARQLEDGSWKNKKDRWYEGNADLVTAYAVLAMQAALDGTEAQ
jgi:squalene-hopene/tetraprenyl-beta-curcumene cyclase